MDGKDENGLKLEKVGPTFSRFVKGCLNKKYFYGLLVLIQFIRYPPHSLSATFCA